MLSIMESRHRTFFSLLLTVLLAMPVLGASHATVRAAELLMFEQAGCYWCKVWDEEVGVAYPKTAEGQLAPLRRLDIHGKLPDEFAGLAPGRFTPTFVVWHEGREIGRIQGYPGGHFFWPMLQDILKQVDPGIGEAAAGGSPS